MKSLLIALAYVVTFATGWFGGQWWNGSLINAGDAAAATQQTGNQFVQATRAVDAATETLDQTRERVRTIIKEVPVRVPECPDGVGLVSAPAAASMRAAAQKASASTANPIRVR
jgi:hypothetical protein